MSDKKKTKKPWGKLPNGPVPKVSAKRPPWTQIDKLKKT